jgi:ABC-type glycerol-3-phosphate transport system permease component
VPGAGAEVASRTSHAAGLWQPGKATAYLLLTTGAIVFLTPFLWMVVTSLKAPAEVMQYPPRWIPDQIQWVNYLDVWKVVPFLLFFKNSIVVTGLCIVGELLTSSMVAFAFARLEFRGREPLFWLVLSTMMLPGQVTMIPVFILFNWLGWVDTLKPLIVPSFLGGGAFYIFLLRQFFTNIPRDLDDAAKIDGCSPFTLYWKIILPLSKPALATVAVFSFVGHWNDFMTPLIYLNSPENQTIAVGLQSFRGQYGTDLHLLMAASTLALLPVLAIFASAQRYFIQGITFTGMKE